MTVYFDNCSLLYEKVAFFIMAASMLGVIGFGFVVFTNEKEPKKGEWHWLEILGPFHPVFTKKYLNEVGVRYWPCFATCFVLVLIMALMFWGLDFCLAKT